MDADIETSNSVGDRHLPTKLTTATKHTVEEDSPIGDFSNEEKFAEQVARIVSIWAETIVIFITTFGLIFGLFICLFDEDCGLWRIIQKMDTHWKGMGFVLLILFSRTIRDIMKELEQVAGMKRRTRQPGVPIVRRLGSRDQDEEPNGDQGLDNATDTERMGS